MSNTLRTSIPAIGLLALLVSPFSVISAAAVEGSTATPAVINTVCPMDGKAIDPTKSKMVMITVGEGADAKKCNMAFCSEEECSEFKKDPGTALKAWFQGPKAS